MNGANGAKRDYLRRETGNEVGDCSVSSIYIWSKNFSHSAYVKSEAKDGGH